MLEVFPLYLRMGYDIHKISAVHMAVGKSVNLRAILRYNGKLPT